jgi:hypothetical protein
MVSSPHRPKSLLVLILGIIAVLADFFPILFILTHLSPYVWQEYTNILLYPLVNPAYVVAVIGISVGRPVLRAIRLSSSSLGSSQGVKVGLMLNYIGLGFALLETLIVVVVIGGGIAYCHTHTNGCFHIVY